MDRRLPWAVDKIKEMLWHMIPARFSLGGDQAAFVDVILDEDDMASDDENALATQQSIKAYVDDTVLVEGDIDHGNLAGLTDDDHPYLLLAGGVMTGDIEMTTGETILWGPGGVSSIGQHIWQLAHSPTGFKTGIELSSFQFDVWTGDGGNTSIMSATNTVLDLPGNITLDGTVDGIDLQTQATLIGYNTTHRGRSGSDHAGLILHSLADAANDFLVASGDDTFVKKTLAETGAILEGDINHNNLVGYEAGEHIAEGTLDHDALTNTHNLTTDIDHDALTNFEGDEHFTEASIDHDALANTHDLGEDIDHDDLTNTHDLGEDIDHDDLTNTHNLTTDIDHGNIQGLSTGADHSYIDQDVTVGASPSFGAGTKITGTSAYMDFDETDSTDPLDVWRVKMNADDFIIQYWDDSASDFIYNLTLADGGLMTWDGWGFKLISNAPAIYMYETDATDPADSWRIIYAGNNFKIGHYDDSEEGLNLALLITPGRHIDFYATYFDINQQADSAGLRVYGFDDEDDKVITVQVANDGHAWVTSTLNLNFQAVDGNVTSYIPAGHHLMVRLGDTTGASRQIWYDSGWDPVASITSFGDVVRRGFFDAHDVGGGVVLATGSWVVLNWDNQNRVDSDFYTFRGTPNYDIRFLVAGDYRLTYDGTGTCGANATRFQSQWRAELYPTGGPWAAIPGTTRYAYHRQTAPAQSVSCTKIITVAAGDYLRITASSNHATNVTTVADSCAMTIEKIS